EIGNDNLLGLVAPAWVSGDAVVLGVDRLGVNDGALAAELSDERMVACREIDVVAGGGGRGRTHVLRVVRVLERERDAVHWHRPEVRIAAVLRVELRGALERIGLLPELLAHARRARGQGALRRMAVPVAFTSDRTLAADVQGAECVDLIRTGRAHRHAVLLLHVRIRGSRLHPTKLDWRSPILTIVGQQSGNGDRLG